MRTMVDLLSLELAKARLRVKRAELALKRAKELLDEDCGVGINIALCSRIRFAQRRVIEARARLMKIANGAAPQSDPGEAGEKRPSLRHHGNSPMTSAAMKIRPAAARQW